MKKEEIFEYVQKQYGTMPEYLWSKLSDSAVLRHKNGKWCKFCSNGTPILKSSVHSF